MKNKLFIFLLSIMCLFPYFSQAMRRNNWDDNFNEEEIKQMYQYQEKLDQKLLYGSDDEEDIWSDSFEKKKSPNYCLSVEDLGILAALFLEYQDISFFDGIRRGEYKVEDFKELLDQSEKEINKYDDFKMKCFSDSSDINLRTVTFNGMKTYINCLKVIKNVYAKTKNYTRFIENLVEHLSGLINYITNYYKKSNSNIHPEIWFGNNVAINLMASIKAQDRTTNLVLPVQAYLSELKKNCSMILKDNLYMDINEKTSSIFKKTEEYKANKEYEESRSSNNCRSKKVIRNTDIQSPFNFQNQFNNSSNIINNSYPFIPSTSNLNSQQEISNFNFNWNDIPQFTSNASSNFNRQEVLPNSNSPQIVPTMVNFNNVFQDMQRKNKREEEKRTRKHKNNEDLLKGSDPNYTESQASFIFNKSNIPQVFKINRSLQDDFGTIEGIGLDPNDKEQVEGSQTTSFFANMPQF